MKKILLSLAACFVCSGATFADLETSGILSNKEEFLGSHFGTFSLSLSKSSEAVCRVYFPLPRTQTWAEWVQGQQVVPQQYRYVSRDWDVGSEIEIHSRDILDESFSFALNRGALESCSHYLLNKKTGAILLTSIEYMNLETPDEIPFQEKRMTEKEEDSFLVPEEEQAAMKGEISEEEGRVYVEEISENFEIFLNKKI